MLANFVFLAVLCIAGVSSRPQNSRQEEARHLPSLSPPILFVRPLFTVDGDLIEDEVINRDESQEQTIALDDRPRANERAEQPDPDQQFDSIFDEFESLPDQTPEIDLNLPVLPVFGQPDLILEATKDLSSKDINQEQFIKSGGSNAGLLPLAFESSGSLNLFPPLRPALRLPKAVGNF